MPPLCSTRNKAGRAAPLDMNDLDAYAARFFYDGSRYFLDTHGQFVPMDFRSVERHLKAYGLPKEDVAPIVNLIQCSQYVNFSGPLAGYQRGIYEMNGAKVLATNSPRVPAAVPGKWETLKAVIKGLLEDDTAGRVQIDTFMAWLKIARESLAVSRYRPGQVLALAGPRGCGKSLLIDIVEHALGGRRANPYPFFSGRTGFNADLAGAELLAVDDEAGSSDIRARKNLAANIKACLFSGSVRVEAKNKNAFSFRPVWRMMMALNDEPENLLVLPIISEDVADKITLLRCHKRELPMPAYTMEERDAFFAQLVKEIPAMLSALERWEVPEDLREQRCGVKAFHHPSILASRHELSPEGQLAQLIDAAAASGSLPLPWTGTAAALKSMLTASPTTARDAERLLGGWAAATGVYLARMEGGRVQRLPMLDGVLRWRVLPAQGGSGEVGIVPELTF